MTCPRCGRTLDESNRLVTDYCGHSKCRSCLILEESNCEECKQSSQDFLATALQTTESSFLLENRPIAQDIQKQQSMNKLKRSRTLIPSFIEIKKTASGKIVYFCRVCNKNFNSRTQQYYHIYCNDDQNKPHKCDKCEKVFYKCILFA